MIGTRTRDAVAKGGWRVRSDQATIALIAAIVVGLLAGVYFGLRGRGQVAVQVATVRAGTNGAELVPTGAVVIDPELQRPVVFVVVNHHALRQPVTVVPPAGAQAMLTITSGLSTGAEVVLQPPDTLHDGSPVRVTPPGGG